MRYLSVCSGVEAATVAWHHMGWEPAAFSEIEKFPSSVLAHHYPNVPNLGDMTKYKEWNIGAIDLLVGGTPCQSFSVAGLRKGLDDPRGNLALVYCGILDHYRPQWFVWENVPGVLSSSGGRDFGSFLGALAQLGYGFAYRVLDAQYFGVAQRRRRVFVVGYLGDWRPAAAVLFESKGLSRDTAPSREARQETAGSTPLGLGSDGQLARALNACKTAAGRMDVSVDTFVAEPVAYRKSRRAQSTSDVETWVNDGAANTLSVFDSGDTRTTHAVVQPIPLNSMTFGRENEKNTRQCLGIGSPGDPVPTLSKTHSHAVAQPVVFENSRRDGVRIYGDVANTLQAFSGTGGGNAPCLTQPVGVDVYNAAFSGDVAVPLTNRSDATGTGPTVMQSMAVRRLTPVECERLQGFPDNYTNIKENCPDGPRYKAMGNSMAVPVMRWIGERINAQSAIQG